MSMHTILLREHNRVAAKRLELNTNWDGETIFQETRKILGAMMQKITYDDWLPKFLGQVKAESSIPKNNCWFRPPSTSWLESTRDTTQTPIHRFPMSSLSLWGDRQTCINYKAIANDVRFAHTLINPVLFRFDKDFKPIKEGHIPLHKAFFAPERLLSEGL